MEKKRELIKSWQKVKDTYRDASFEIVLAGQHCKLEAWILNGFEPQNKKEVTLLADLRRELGFSPVSKAEKLTAVSTGAKKNAKRVLHCLTDSIHNRQDRCWEETSLKVLRENGANTGLTDYLSDVEGNCAPCFNR